MCPRTHTDNNFGVRDNGAGQLWSATEKVGSINYWTGSVVGRRLNESLTSI
jgi:hypothetical protein